jgi:hypothetical protein
MNSLIQFKKPTPIILALALAFFGLSPEVQAVSPPPDGCYPNFTTAEGCNALFSLTSGVANTAIGSFSLKTTTDGSFNTGVGAATLLFNTGNEDTAVGGAALLFNTTGSDNVAVGVAALLSNTEGDDNTAIGRNALASNTSGDHNTAAGFQALFSNSTGDFNTANGDSALFSNTTGMANTALGVAAGFNVTTANHVIAIGIGGADVSNSCFIGNIRGTTTAQNNAIPVLIDMAGQLGTVSSSARFKKDIKPMENASEAIHALKPVTFHYKSDNTNRPEFGLVAEQVAKVNPDLVVRDDNGEIYTVRYEAVNAMLLNEFLKEHKAFVEQRHKVEQLEATVVNLATTVKEQAAQIQKVSAQFELSKPARKAVLNNN